MNRSTFCFSVLWVMLVSTSLRADLVNGLISDFQDGTTQGWEGGTVETTANSGPLGNGDFSIQLANGGAGGRFAMYNTGVRGIISPTVNSVFVDIRRPAGLSNAEIRMVLINLDSTRWTSTNSALIIGDGVWRRYQFSILEADLTRVIGTSTYEDLTGFLDRIMFRHDPGAPSAGGASLAGTMNFDNITAVPEPSTALWLILGLTTLAVRGQRSPNES